MIIAGEAPEVWYVYGVYVRTRVQCDIVFVPQVTGRHSHGTRFY